jgi:hypothetical protein
VLQVRSRSDAKGGEVEALCSEAAVAEAAGRGLHCTDPMLRVQSCFTFDADRAAASSDFIAVHGKGEPVAAIVDAVLTGSVLKLVTATDRVVVTFALAGAQCPGVKRRPDGTLEGDPYGLEVRHYPELFPTNHEFA